VGGLRLQHRIVIPFIVIALIATTAAAYVTWRVTSEALQSRLQTQLRNSAVVVSQSGLALNPAILRNLQQIIGAEIVTFDDQDRIVATTTTAEHQKLVDAARRVIAAHRPLDPAASDVEATDCGVPCLIAFRPVVSRPGTVVALIAETSEVSSALRTVARVILIATTLSVLVMIFVSQAVVRRVTAPLDKLVRFVSELSPATSKRAEVGADEIGELAGAFNKMLDRVESSQTALVRSEKLATAGLIAARVAHDIRNPLSSIKMQSQLLKSQLERDADASASLTAVLHDIAQMESVILDLLELARPGELRLEQTAVNDVLRDALRQLAAQFKHRKIAINGQLEDGLPELRLDQHRLRQALLNVLNNASDAMPTGGTLTVTARRDGADAVLVEICDDGIGVEPGLIDKVFDPFVSSKRDGVGLGLVNAKAVVEGHGGQIRLAPRTEGGTCVSIRLPIPSSSSGTTGGGA
jgi:signal transduction histidine kinase